MNRRLWTLAALASACAATSLAPVSASAWEITGGSWGKRVEGSGKMVDELRPLGAFSKVRLSESFDVKAKLGSRNAITVHADDNLLPLILTTVEGDTLVIKTKPDTGYRSKGPITLTLEFTQLSAVSMQGSGDLEIDGAKGDLLDISLAGSGDLKLKGSSVAKLGVSVAGSGDVLLVGKCQQLTASIAGSGNIDAAQLPCAIVGMKIAGSGDAKVNASESLAVQIAGSGDVTYSGQPKITQSIAGSGSLTPAR